MVEPLEIAHRVAQVALDRQASDILLLDLRGLSAFTDFFVILTGETTRQIDALSSEIEEALPVEPHHREGSAEGGWVLLDYGGVVVHIFAPEQRRYYALEEVWARATPLLRIP